MTGFEFVAVIVLFLVGYWLVSAVWPKRASDKSGSGEQRAGDAASGQTSADSHDAWHRVLGVAATASVDEIKHAYHAQVSKYHPDKVAQMGPELQAVAHDMTQKINAAYEQALKAKGL